ncbi:MAG: hypothetical protein RIC80_05600 [Cyclobacteriaceae bacterium]
MKSSIVAAFLLLFSLSTFAQMRATTEDGRAVLLMRDGTWKFADQAAAPTNYDCNSLTKQLNDQKSAAQKPIRMQGARGADIGFFPQKDGNYVTMLIDAQGDDQCMITGSVVNLTFRDGTIVDMKNSGEANCDGRGLLTLGTNDKSNKMLTLFKTKELATVRVWNKTTSTLAILDPEESKMLLNTYWCLLGR